MSIKKRIEINSTAVQECLFGAVKECKKQNLKNKPDLQICQCCLLSRIEQHLYSVVKHIYSGNNINSIRTYNNTRGY